MRLFLLADQRSPHIIKWTNALLERDIEIFLFGFTQGNRNNYCNTKKLHFASMNLDENYFSKPDGKLSKIIYLKSLIKLKKLIKEFSPDILHAHYASSYGLLGVLSGFKPFIISVWGADVYNFPKINWLTEWLLKYNLAKANKILSTSITMAHEIKKYSSKRIEITPFGIDVSVFKPIKIKRLFDDDSVVIGTIKSLEKKYGIEILIKAYHLFKQRNPQIKTNLLIVGGGTQRELLISLIKSLKLENETVLTGFIDYNKIVEYHNMIDIYISVSVEDSESFGVAVLEASACEKPVIVSNIGGLPEVVENNVTGMVVEPENEFKTSEAIEKLVLEKKLRKILGVNGRERVINLYNLNDNVDKMINIYNDLFDSYHKSKSIKSNENNSQNNLEEN